MKKAILLIVAITGSWCAKAQQDSQFTQYVFNGIHINPAYAGYKEDLYVQSFYRAQWEGIKGAPRSFSVAADGAVKDGNVGLGLILSNDQIGAQSYLTAYANYAYRIRVGYDESSRLSFGLAAGIMQLGIDANKLESIQSGDEYIAISSQTKTFPDARFGAYYSNEKYFAGFSVTNMLARYAARNQSNLLVPVPQPHFYFTAGAQFPLSDEVMLKPVILLKDDTKGPTSLDLNAFFLLKEKVWLGAFYRTSVGIYQKEHLQDDLTKRNAMGMMVELFATSNIRVGYSYDYALNKLRNYNYGSHELSVGFYLHPMNLRRMRQLRCYDF